MSGYNQIIRGDDLKRQNRLLKEVREAVGNAQAAINQERSRCAKIVADVVRNYSIVNKRAGNAVVGHAIDLLGQELIGKIIRPESEEEHGQTL